MQDSHTICLMFFLSTLSLDGCPLRRKIVFMAMLDPGGMQLHSNLGPGAHISKVHCI